MIPLQHYLFLGAILFCAGLVIVVVKRNNIMVLMGIELMLNASIVNLVAFNMLYPERFHGQLFALFVMVIAVCEAAVGLAIILRVYQRYQTSIPDDINVLKD